MAGGLAAFIARPGAGGSPRHPASSHGQGPLQAVAAARDQAARWVAGNVSPSAIVGCDPELCAALQARGRPAASLLVLNLSAADPLDAEVVVATAAVRSQFGTRLNTVYAPAVLARFGTGPARIEVRVVAAGGARAYQTALDHDLTQRKLVSAQLLGNARIDIAGPARAALAAGQVDARLLLMLAALAAVHPVQVLSFGGAGPGASAGQPLRSAALAGAHHPGDLTQSSYLRWIEAFLRHQRTPYQARTSVSPGGVLDIQFPAPSPLGLITSSPLSSAGR